MNKDVTKNNFSHFGNCSGNRLQRKVLNYSGTSISDMIWGNAARKFIPPIVT